MNFRNMAPNTFVFNRLLQLGLQTYRRAAGGCGHGLGKVGAPGILYAVEVFGNIPATKPDSARANRQERSSVFIRGAPSFFFVIFSTVFLGKSWALSGNLLT